MKKTALLAVLLGLFCANLAYAQQGDVMFGVGTLMSSGSCNPFTGVCPEKGGAYTAISGDVIFHGRFGIGFDTAWRASQGLYFSQPFRPILTDFNGVYQPNFSKKLGADLMGGIGWQSTRFYLPYCTGYYTCNNFVSSHHFLIDLGAGIRYYVWKGFFLRPEVHYYYVLNNSNDFTSDNLFRVGASIGYTIGGNH